MCIVIREECYLDVVGRQVKMTLTLTVALEIVTEHKEEKHAANLCRFSMVAKLAPTLSDAGVPIGISRNGAQ